MALNNVLISVQGYVTDEALPALDNALVVTRSFDGQFKNWDKPETYGTRGDSFQIKKQTRFSVQDTLNFDPVTSGAFQEQYMNVTADKEALVNYAATDMQLATFEPKSLMMTNKASAITTLSNQIEQDSARTAALGGYRFFGNPIIQPGQLQSVGEVTNSVARMRSFGGMGEAHYIMPLDVAAQVIQSGLQQFAPKRNDEIADEGEIGYLGGVDRVRFLQSTLLPIHTAGTMTTTDVAINQGTGFTIDSVVVVAPGATAPNGTTTFTLSGVTTGATIVENDMIQITPQAGSAPLRYLNYYAHDTLSLNPIQGRVTVGDTADGGGNITFTIEPALIFDASGVDVNRNLSRDIITGGAGDKLVVTESHRAGAFFFTPFIKFVNPKLPSTDPFTSVSEVTDDSAISLRCYHGYVFGANTTQFVHDSLYGYGVAPEGVTRLVYPVDSTI